MSARASRTWVPERTLAAAALSTTMSILPVFLLSALAVLIRDELRFSETQLGAAVSIYYVVSTLAMVPAGWLAERVGAHRAMALAITISSTSLLGMAALAQGWYHVAGFLALAGISKSVSSPAANLALARAISPARQGMAFGLKQAAVPAAGVLAGVTVPVIGLTLGWRWAFAGAVLAALAFFLVAPPYQPSGTASVARARAGDAATTPLVTLGIAAGFATAACTALGVFYVESGVANGIDVGVAGLWLSVGSASSIGGRILWGWLADRRNGKHFLAVAWLQVAGAIGFVLLAFAYSPLILALGTILAFGAGWGWNGLFVYAVVRQNPNAPAASSAIVLGAVSVGGILGPVAFGALVERTSYTFTWLCAASAMIAAAGIVHLGRVSLRRDIAKRAAA